MTPTDDGKEDTLRDLISCPRCGTVYRIPHTDQTLKITCSHCHSVFYKNPFFVASGGLGSPSTKKDSKISGQSWAIALIAVLVVGVFIVWLVAGRNHGPDLDAGDPQGQQEYHAAKPLAQSTGASDWVTISYAGLVDGSTLTHSGETVAELVPKVPRYDDDLQGLVQPYLEPFSVLCHDVVLAKTEGDTIPFMNITAHYPQMLTQPAWATLFREGHFQLYYSPQTIRLFLKGSDPQESLRSYRSIVRHALRDVVDCYPASMKNLEVYVFKNDYSSLEIRLNTIPAVYAIDTVDLSAQHKDVDLASIENLLSEGVILEAVEVDNNNDLYFYGRKASEQTIAGAPLSLSDIAVVYRSVFHYGHNAPYISLDKNEDNRYAKVNFGGHLENTRVGQVVLEADKLFKTLGTGLDPNTHELVKSKIARQVPGFLTEDERSLIQEETGRSLIRYWFYPDSIGTVTDGSIGAVETNQFMADVERMDVKRFPGVATMETINHLNRHFIEYENAEDTYKELSTVGRIMALVNWLKGMNMNERIELDDFLAVPLPACTTPSRTKKMLAVSTTAYPRDSRPDPSNIRTYTQVFYLSHLLDRCDASASDERLMDAAAKSVDGISHVALPGERRLRSTIAYYKPLMKDNESRIASYEREIEQRKYTLDQTSEYDVNRYNDLVNRYNDLIETQKANIDSYNEAIQELNAMEIRTRQLVSIGGGIDLSPRQFKVISRDVTSPRIRELTIIKNSLRNVGKVDRSAEWVRNKPSLASWRENLMPRGKWIRSRSSGIGTKYDYRIDPRTTASASVSSEKKEWVTRVTINGVADEVKFSKSQSLLQVNHPTIRGNVIGKFSPDERRIVFSRSE